MKEYEFNVTIRRFGDVWHYVIAQEFDERVEFLGWGYAETVDEASNCVGRYIKEQFVEA